MFHQNQLDSAICMLGNDPTLYAYQLPEQCISCLSKANTQGLCPNWQSYFEHKEWVTQNKMLAHATRYAWNYTQQVKNINILRKCQQRIECIRVSGEAHHRNARSAYKLWPDSSVTCAHKKRVNSRNETMTDYKLCTISNQSPKQFGKSQYDMYANTN